MNIQTLLVKIRIDFIAKYAFTVKRNINSISPIKKITILKLINKLVTPYYFICNKAKISHKQKYCISLKAKYLIHKVISGEQIQLKDQIY